MTLQKIDEWIKEIEDRPASALTILKLISGRLHDLTERNEELLAENIALEDGTRVEELRKRIAHLEFQLDLLKRRFSLDETGLTALAVEPPPAPNSLLIYNALGRILRLEPSFEAGPLGRLQGDLSAGGEPPRLLALPGNEEVLLLFTSGRIGTAPLDSIPVQTGDQWNLDEGALPDEPRGGERLACLMPLSWLPMADFFLQVSRRGWIKKTMTSIAETVFTNHYLGKGAVEKLDQSFDLLLCSKGNRYALVSWEGRLLGMDVDDLSYSVEERIKLDGTDHVVAGFVYKPDQQLLCLTQTGKVVTKAAGYIEPMKTGASRGQALIPASRLQQGVRFIGAAPIADSDRLAVLDGSGHISLHACSDLLAAGSIPDETPLLAFGILSSVPGKKPTP